MVEEFTKNSFYWSLTNGYLETHEEIKLWDAFAGNHGVRMVLSIEDVNTDLRQVYYQPVKKIIPLLKNLADVCHRYGRELHFTALSKVGFFYLSSTFNDEHESRFLITRRQAQSKNLSIQIHDNGYEYLALPFCSPFATIKLLKIIAGNASDIPRIQGILSSYPGYEKVVIYPRP